MPRVPEAARTPKHDRTSTVLYRREGVLFLMGLIHLQRTLLCFPPSIKHPTKTVAWRYNLFQTFVVPFGSYLSMLMPSLVFDRGALIGSVYSSRYRLKPPLEDAPGQPEAFTRSSFFFSCISLKHPYSFMSLHFSTVDTRTTTSSSPIW